MRNVTEANFQTDVLDAERPVLVDFYADWCGACQNQKPVLEALAQEGEGRADVVKVNVDEEQALARAYGVRSIPTLILFSGGEAVATRIGMTPKQDLASLLAE